MRVPDSLTNRVKSLSLEIDSLQKAVQKKVDSLQKLNLPTGQYQALVDSLNRIDVNRDIRKAEASLKNEKSKVDKFIAHKADSIELKINSTLNKYNEQGAKFGKVSGPKVGPNLETLPGSKSLPSLPGSNIKMQELNANGMTNTPLITNPTLEINQEVKQIESQVPLGEIKGIENEAKVVSGQATEYSKEIKNLSEGDMSQVNKLSKDAEQEALKLKELDPLRKGQSEVTQYQNMLGKGNDKKALKKIALDQAQKQGLTQMGIAAVNHFQGKEKEVESAMGQMSKLKKKFNSIKDFEEAARKRPNAMHDKPLVERLVPGLTLQLMSGTNNVQVDFNPSVAYLFNTRLSAGLGYVVRVGFHDLKATTQNRVFGFRSFGEFKLSRGFSARLDVEDLNAQLPQPQPGSGPNDVSERTWGVNIFTGFKKDFKLYKGIRGNVQTLYRIWNQHSSTPYPDRLTVRVGFEFPMKKKVAKKEE